MDLFTYGDYTESVSQFPKLSWKEVGCTAVCDSIHEEKE